MRKKEIIESICIVTVFAIVSLFIVDININSKVNCEEIWSGKIIEVCHKEEWDEYIPSKTIEKVDSKGKKYKRYIPPQNIHHYSENSIKTSDGGWISVKTSPDGKQKFNDNYPNTTKELENVWKIGSPSASIHTYKNKVKCSYSIYKHNEIDLSKFKDLPDYPKEIKRYISLDRIVGDVPNKQQAQYKLSAWNSELNKNIVDSKTGKTKSWKEVNVVFVNVGENKSKDYGFALQDKWENGNKNDFIVCFSMNKNGAINWVYSFSWNDDKRLQTKVGEYFSKNKTIQDFSVVVDDICVLVREGFKRKEFADFEYIQVEVDGYVKVIIIILAMVYVFAIVKI